MTARALAALLFALVALAGCKGGAKRETVFVAGVEYVVTRTSAESPGQEKVVVHRGEDGPLFAKGRLVEGHTPFGEWTRFYPDGKRAAYGIYPEKWTPRADNGAPWLPGELTCWSPAGDSVMASQPIIISRPTTKEDGKVWIDTATHHVALCQPFPAEIFWTADEVKTIPTAD